MSAFIAAFLVCLGAYIFLCALWVGWLSNKIEEMNYANHPLTEQALNDFWFCPAHLNPIHWLRTFRIYRKVTP